MAFAVVTSETNKSTK